MSAAPQRLIDTAELLTSHEEQLFRTLSAIQMIGGFGQVIRSNHKAQKRVAQRFAAEVAAEGWVT